jgi:Peptidase family C25
VLVADNADLGGPFEAESDELAVGVLAGRDEAKVYLRELGDATRATVRSELDGGASIVSYTGHGRTAVWVSENILNNTDVASLAPQAQQPLLLR